MSILITGGAGYIGSHVAVQMINKGYDVIILDNYSNSKPEMIANISRITEQKFLFYDCDILDFNTLNEIFKENKIDTVMHFAGLKAVSESVENPLQYYTNNITGSLNLFNVMELNKVKSLVFSSSAAVYGDNLTPNMECMEIRSSTNPYGQTKVFQEYILKDLQACNPEWNITVLRYYNVVGAHKSTLIGDEPKGVPNNLFPYIAEVAIGNLSDLTIYGDDYDTKDGTPMRDYIHVEDLAAGHILALENQKVKKGYNVYNLGTGNPYSVLEMVEAFKKINKIAVPYKIGKRRVGDLAISFADISKAKEELGFVCNYGINEMCEDSFNWQKRNIFGM
jgi:UDP-glucose 4-epimerase